MPTPPLSPAEAKRRKVVVEKYLKLGYTPLNQTGGLGSAVSAAGKEMGLGSGTMRDSVVSGKVKPDWSLFTPQKSEKQKARLAAPAMPRAASYLPIDIVLGTLRKKQLTLEEIAEQAGISKGEALDAVEAMQERGVNVQMRGTAYVIDSDMAPAFTGETTHEYVSRKDNTFVFGATSDNHLGSRYERLDVLNDLYDRFAKRGVDRVFNAGNWIDGEARFNKFDLHTHGMDAQMRYLAKNYPQRKGITTYAVAGDDHEGWYGAREGVDVGRIAERAMRDAGRSDWVNLGYMEAHIKLVNANTGKSVSLACVHPGGGSAYALSYSIQKIIESLDGGEKPAVGLYGHYHKLWAGNIRNVWCLQTGCTEDQTPFMRKRKLEAHVGGAIVELEQDPKTGSIVGFTPKMIRYFNKGFYNNRWSYSDAVTPADRVISP